VTRRRPLAVSRSTAATLVVLVLALGLAACGSSKPKANPGPPGATPTSATPSSTSGTDADLPAAYVPPDPLPPGQAGDVVKVSSWRPVAGVRTSLVLYRSTAVDGSPRVVSAVVGVPDQAAPPGGWPLLAWAHGTTGLADRCAPSRSPEFDAGLTQVLEQAPQQGFAVVATDYEGLGTAGPHPYVVNIAEAHDVLDSVRAAERLPGTGLTAASKVVVWGHSQGGGAAALSAELAPRYAPDVDLVGAAVGAPATELAGLDVPLRTSPFFGYTLMVASGYRVAYPSLPLSQELTPRGIGELDRVQQECGAESVVRLRGSVPSDYLARPVAEVPALRTALDDNSAGHRPTPVPMFVYQGGSDEQIPVATSARMVERMCDAGGYTVTRKIYPGQGHSQAVLAAAIDVLHFFADRLAGKPAASQCGRDTG
jgi:alpha-beta hydrolase superfamily lysophospholipase